MCVAITRGPTARPRSLHLPGTVNIDLSLQSATRAVVTVECTPPPQLGHGASTSVTVDGDADVSVPVPLDNGRPGIYQIDVTVSQPGCVPEKRAVSIVVP